MKLLLRQYLASLKERGELDVILPDLLSQMGLNVISRPSVGTRQYGVDVAAVGVLNGQPEALFLCSIKSGNLTRGEWDGTSPQSLRASLNEIRDVYIKNQVPNEHAGKPIRIIICIGGEIPEEVRMNLEGYIREQKTDLITYEQWNGDKIAELMERHLLAEHLMPADCQPLLRKSVALIDEPTEAFAYYRRLVVQLSAVSDIKLSERLRRLRQMALCTWILFSWSRDLNNVEASYLGSEYALLRGWEIAKQQLGGATKSSLEFEEAFLSIFRVYQRVTQDYVGKIAVHCTVEHGLSSAIRTSQHIDINITLYDVLGRLGVAGLWSLWEAGKNDKSSVVHRENCQVGSDVIQACIQNNPCLMAPIKDDQAIDIMIVALFIYQVEANGKFLTWWLDEIVRRCDFAYQTHGLYPTIQNKYQELLEHASKRSAEYRQKATAASILYPVIALWSSILFSDKIYSKIQSIKGDSLKHCTFQLWYPDESTEMNIYAGDKVHGVSWTDLPMDKSCREYRDMVWEECEETKHFESLSAIKFGLWPLIAVACRHHRIPLPLDFTLAFRDGVGKGEVGKGDKPLY